jgi:hypothetical protein
MYEPDCLSLRELAATDLEPYAFGKYEEGYIWADPDHETWQGDVDSTLKYLGWMVAQGQSIRDVPFYRSVKNPHDFEKPFYQISFFKSRKEKDVLKSGEVKWRFTIDPMLKEEKQAQKTGRQRGLRLSNKKFHRMWMMGDVDGRIHCPITGENIDEQVFWEKEIDNVQEQHHIVFRGRESLQKEGEDPGKHNSTTDLSVPSEKSRFVLEDMMRTIFLSPTGHKKVHKFTEGDITYYSTKQLMWAMRCKTNYNKFIRFVRSFGYDKFPTYEEWYASLTLEHFDRQQAAQQ